jgi:hypothetical protein
MCLAAGHDELGRVHGGWKWTELIAATFIFIFL